MVDHNRPVLRSAFRLMAASLLASLIASFAVACGGSSGGAENDSAGGLADVGDATQGCVVLASGECVVETFQNPPVLQPDEEGVYWLNLAATEVTLGGKRHCVRAYNGAFVAPTIDTPARSSGARQVRVNLANRLYGHDYRSLEGGSCICTKSSGASCLPEHIHDRCVDASASEDCVCRTTEGELCAHMFDFNVTNLHAHGSHVRPDWARGGAACAPLGRDGIEYDCRPCSEAVCSDSNRTCFHGDNVLNAVHPATGTQYRWDIDEDGTHHTGLQWYHPHIHGTTAIQVASGAAGAWIVRGELDELDGIRDARERILLFSTAPITGDDGFAPLGDDQVCTDATITFNNFATLGSPTALQTNLINGEVKPRMIAAPGQVERWRIVHTGFLDEVFLGMFRGKDADCKAWSTAEADTLRLAQIGRDGIILPQVFSHSHLFMSPGYRIEAILGGEEEFDDGDTWCLVAARFLQASDESTFGPFGAQPMSPPTPPTPDSLLARFSTDGVVVSILNVTAAAGPPTTTSRPDFTAIAALAPPTELKGDTATARCAQAKSTIDPDSIEQAAILQVGLFTADDPDPCDCEAYNVNCRNFEYTDRDRYPVDRDLKLGAVEHWRVQASTDGHPFHIHINPFLVCPNDNPFDPLPFPHWRDTYLVNLDRKVDLLAENRAFTGLFVLHCHKLTHEDHGMMELLRVCDPATDNTCGKYRWQYCEDGDLQCAKAKAATHCALESNTAPALAACMAELAGPSGLCGTNACQNTADCPEGSLCNVMICSPGCEIDADCPVTHRCAANTCVPAPCNPPCLPGQSCSHGSCQ